MFTLPHMQSSMHFLPCKICIKFKVKWSHFCSNNFKSCTRHLVGSLLWQLHRSWWKKEAWKRLWSLFDLLTTKSSQWKHAKCWVRDDCIHNLFCDERVMLPRRKFFVNSPFYFSLRTYSSPPNYFHSSWFHSNLNIITWYRQACFSLITHGPLIPFQDFSLPLLFSILRLVFFRTGWGTPGSSHNFIF